MRGAGNRVRRCPPLRPVRTVGAAAHTNRAGAAGRRRPSGSLRRVVARPGRAGADAACGVHTGGGELTAPGSLQSLYTPDALERWKALSDKDDPSLRCIPVAFGTLNVSLFGLGFIGQIVQTPKFVTMLTETYHSFKIVPVDGRPHRDDVAPSFRGDSVGRWEGDTLVVDTKNFTDENWLYAEGNVSFHSEALHIVERYRRTAANLLQVDATIEDPKVLSAPYRVPTQTLQLAPFDQIMELTCANLDSAALMDAAAKQNYGRK